MVLVYCMPSQNHSIKFHQADFSPNTEYWQFISTKKTQPWYNMLQVSSQTTSVHYVLKPALVLYVFTDAFLRDVIQSPFFKSYIFQSHPC